MKIAVASQNRKNVTAHAGRCRNFWIFNIEYDEISGKTLLELPAEQSFHYASVHDSHPLDGVDVFICGGMGSGLARKLAGRWIKGVVTQEVDPERAVTLYLSGSLPTEEPHDHGHHHHDHHHHDHQHS